MGRTIRQFLKTETAELHEELDRRIGPLVERDTADYLRFLRIQYRARLPVEQWIATADAPSPPQQVPLLAADLRDLGSAMPAAAVWAPPRGGDALGLLWVLAGSSLGNRFLCKRLAAAAPHLPTAFLADRQMTDYWTALRPHLEASPEDRDADAALRMARSVFAHFLAVAESECARETV